MECPVARWAQRTPAAAALVASGEVWSYERLDAEVRALHGRLAGVPRLAVDVESTPRFVALVHAAARAGTALALFNPRLPDGELRALRTALGIPPGLEDLPRALSLTPGPLDPAAVQTLLFTSGTTGVPKAAQLSIGNHAASARSLGEVLGLGPDARYLCNLPLFHVGGLAILFRCAHAGGAAVLQERFDAALTARALEGEVTHASLVPTTLRRTLDALAARPGRLRAALIGGGPVPADLLARARAMGVECLQTYGLTETSSSMTLERPGEADGQTAGRAIPGGEVRVVATEAGHELEVRGPNVSRGYLGSEPFGEWFRTGDLGELDARGRLIVHARRTDLIVRGGENVYPAQVEAALLAHPAVRDAAVVPAPDAEWGQVGVAFVVGEVGEPALRAFLRGRLAPFQVPARFLFLDGLPRNAGGKVDRRALRALLARPESPPEVRTLRER